MLEDVEGARVEHIQHGGKHASGDAVQQSHGGGHSGIHIFHHFVEYSIAIFSYMLIFKLIIISSGDLFNSNRVSDEIWRNLSAFVFIKQSVVSLHLGRCVRECDDGGRFSGVCDLFIEHCDDHHHNQDTERSGRFGMSVSNRGGGCRGPLWTGAVGHRLLFSRFLSSSSSS